MMAIKILRAMHWGQYKQTHFGLYSYVSIKTNDVLEAYLILWNLFFFSQFQNDATAKFTTTDSWEKSGILAILLIETFISCSIFCFGSIEKIHDYKHQCRWRMWHAYLNFQRTLLIRGWFLNWAQTEFPQAEFLLYFLDKQCKKPKGQIA